MHLRLFVLLKLGLSRIHELADDVSDIALDELKTEHASDNPFVCTLVRTST